jgi:hypothetical protein
MLPTDNASIWCTGRGMPPFPADPLAVALFCAREAGCAPQTTITRRLAAIL